VILQLPEVREVAVVAKQDPALQEIPVAFIISKKPMEHDALEELVLNHCAEHLSRFKIPRIIKVVDDFPRSLLNKVAKNKLREIADKL